jgi:hypothetical protein
MSGEWTDKYAKPHPSKTIKQYFLDSFINNIIKHAACYFPNQATTTT